MTEFLKCLEAGEQNIFSLETEKYLPGAFHELPEATARTEEFPVIKILPTACRIQNWPFVVVKKAGRRTPPAGR